MGERVIDPLFNTFDSYTKMIINPYRFGGGGGGGNGLLTDLVAYYKLDETSGTRVDSHATFDLTDNNSVGSTTGKIGNAADFVAANSEYLSHPDDAAFDITGALSIAGWIKIDTTGSFETLLGKWLVAGDQRAYNLYITNAEKVVFGVTSDGTAGTFTPVNGSLTLSTATWYHIVAVYKPSISLELYVNGALDEIQTSSVPAAIHNSTAQLTVGSVSGSSYVDGAIDEVAIYSRALSASDVVNLFASGSGLPYESFTS